jgi:hypothetical protein
VEVGPLSIVRLAIAVVTGLEVPSTQWQAATAAAGHTTEIGRAIIAIFEFEAAAAIGAMPVSAWHLEYFMLLDT